MNAGHVLRLVMRPVGHSSCDSVMIRRRCWQPGCKPEMFGANLNAQPRRSTKKVNDDDGFQLFIEQRCTTLLLIGPISLHSGGTAPHLTKLYLRLKFCLSWSGFA